MELPKKAESLRTKKFEQLVRNRLDKKIHSMGLPNENILSQNRKSNSVNLKKELKQGFPQVFFFLAALGNILN